MPTITFTEWDKAQAAMGDADPTQPATPLFRIESADDCEGIRCGERPELALPADDYDRYVREHGERPPVGPHSHLVGSWDHPPARASYVAVLKAAKAENRTKS